MDNVKKISREPIVTDDFAITAYTTVQDAYIDLPGGTFSVRIYKTKLFQWLVSTNTLKIKVLGSLDGGATFPHTAIAEVVVAASTTPTKSAALTDLYTDLKIQVATNAGGQNGILTAAFAGFSF